VTETLLPRAWFDHRAAGHQGLDNVDEARFEHRAPDRLHNAGAPQEVWGTMRSLAERASRLRSRANLVEFRTERMTNEHAMVEGIAWAALLRRRADEQERECRRLLDGAASPPGPHKP
jgi:hypothetical protein